MAGWDGSGNFILPYSMVAEAAAGVKILASHQDTQWNAVAVGLENCLTLDGQNSPTADIPWATHKITGLGDPGGAQDAATKNYVDTAVAATPVPTEWTTESHAVAYVDATHFKVTGVDVTATYHAGRRVKVTHNGGATTSYGTVISSVFGADTTVLVAMDSSTALVTTVTAVAYGLLSYTNPSYLDPRTAISVTTAADLAYPVANTLTKLPFNTESFDTLGEFDSAVNYRFTPQHPGIYLISCQTNFLTSGVAQISFGPFIYKNGVNVSAIFDGRTINSLTAAERTIGEVLPLSLVKGDYIEFYFSSDHVGTVYGATTFPDSPTRAWIVRIA